MEPEPVINQRHLNFDSGMVLLVQPFTTYRESNIHFNLSSQFHSSLPNGGWSIHLPSQGKKPFSKSRIPPYIQAVLFRTYNPAHGQFSLLL